MPRTWRLLRGAVLASLVIGAGLGAVVWAAVASRSEGWVGGIPAAAATGAGIGLANGLVAVVAALAVRRVRGDERWSVAAAAVAVLLGWLLAASLHLALGQDLSGAVVLAAVGVVAASLTAVAAQTIIGRQTPSPS